MKTILLILLTIVLAYAKAPFWVQVIAVKHPSSLTKQFLSKAKKCYKNYRIINQNGYEKVWLGKFKNATTANNAKNFFQTCLSKNAFVISGYIPKKHKKHNLIEARKSILLKPKKIKKTLSSQIMQITANTVSLRINTKSLAQTKVQNIQSPAVKEHAPICTKQQSRESEIASAIKFYRHSKYYRFNSP